VRSMEPMLFPLEAGRKTTCQHAKSTTSAMDPDLTSVATNIH
jgi:hypothetical protein